MSEYLDNVSNEEFMETYNKIEKGIGPTIEEYLGDYNISIKDMVKNKTVTFMFYKEKELWYITEDGFEFPVPIDDVGTASMNKTDKAILYMRWIRKHLETVKSWEEQRDVITDVE